MKTYVRCKACGYIIEENKLKDVCPACGVSKKAFEPFQDKVSARRRMLLELHIHPIIVHFPQGFSIFFLFALVMGIFLPSGLKDYFFSTARVIAFFLPLAVLGGLASGLFDGKIRFKKISRPVLIQKIITGSVFFALSMIIAILSVGFAFQDTLIVIVIIIASVLALGCTALLGRSGAKLTDAVLPG